jgi:hypothetical protein
MDRAFYPQSSGTAVPGPFRHTIFAEDLILVSPVSNNIGEAHTHLHLLRRKPFSTVQPQAAQLTVVSPV